MSTFNAARVTEEIVLWIRDFFDKNGKGCKAVVGISGGKDSSVVAALCSKALGNENVVGVLMPYGEQPYGEVSDIGYAHFLCDYLHIQKVIVPITKAVNSIIEGVDVYRHVSTQAMINVQPRVRMATLYAVSQSVDGRVANTCNLSEDWIGYSTRYGDSVGDFSPCSKLTSDEVIEIGKYLGLPDELVYKVPADGLCGKSDEENFGFSYEVLNKYIRTGVCEDADIKKKIDEMHTKNLFKLELMPSFEYKI